jgi:hypothetical protein
MTNSISISLPDTPQYAVGRDCIIDGRRGRVVARWEEKDAGGFPAPMACVHFADETLDGE